MTLRNDAQMIIREALEAAQPDRAVEEALGKLRLSAGRLFLAAVGKAAWQMAKVALEKLPGRVDEGIVITKYGHSRGELPGLRIFEAGHPVPDENSFRAADAIIRMVSGLSEKDTVLFLLSGGGSALFEKPLIPAADLEALTKALLACGADITEINTLRKRFSAVKGGRFAKLCEPAHVFGIILSDVLGDRVDMIASGPTAPDASTCAEAEAIVRKYGLKLTPRMAALLKEETPKQLRNVENHIGGSVKLLCRQAAASCRALGYRPVLLTDELSCTAREAGRFFGAIARTHAGKGEKLAFIAGGETVVQLTGSGLGGRNQELALAAAPALSGLDALLFSLGSDGTDGPTDAAGGMTDGSSEKQLSEQGIRVEEVLADNDSYHALQKCGGLILTGPTGTNVNDLSVLLIGS